MPDRRPAIDAAAKKLDRWDEKCKNWKPWGTRCDKAVAKKQGFSRTSPFQAALVKNRIPSAILVRALGLLLSFSAEAGEIHDAAKSGDIVKVRQLLTQGIPVNARDKDQCTPLHWATAAGRTEVAKLLMRSGADVNARDSFQWTPAVTAEKNNHPDLASLIREQGAGGSR